MRVFFTLFCLLIVAQNTLKAQVDKSKYALLWEISGKDLPKPTYVFGSMHLPDARVFELADSVMILLDACEAFAAEVDLDSAVNMTVNEKLGEGDYWYGADRELNLKLHQPKIVEVDEKKEEKPFVEENAKPEPKEEPKKQKTRKPKRTKKNKEKPKTIKEDAPKLDFDMDFLRTKISDKNTFLDSYLAYKAKTHGKQLYGLEVLEQHMTMYDGQMGAGKSKGKPKEFEGLSYKEVYEKMLDFYRSGDLDQITKFTQELEDDSIMVLRNRIMVNSILRIATQKTLFSVMGCAHLIGEYGVINMFRQRGYTVRKVTPEFTKGDPDKYLFKSPEVPITWYENHDLTYGYAVETPQKAGDMPILGMRINTFNPLTIGRDYTHSFDVLTGSVYSFGSTKQDTLNYEAVMAQFVEVARGGINAKKTFRAGDLEGLEAIIYDKTDTLQAVRVRVLHAQGNRYILMALAKGQYLQEPYITRFFESFKLKPNQKKWQTYKNQQGAFAVNMFGAPYEKRGTSSIEIDGREEYRQIYHVFRTEHEAENTRLVAMYRDMAQGMTLEADSILFKHIEQYIKTNLDTIFTQKEATFEGYPSRTYMARAGKEQIRIWTCLRGNRHYILAQAMPEGIQDSAFFTSFRLLPFESFDLERKTHKIAKFSALIPKTKTHEQYKHYRREVFSDMYSYNSTDPKTGIAFSTDALKYSKYAYLTHQDSLTQIARKLYITPEDTILPTKASYTLFKRKNANTYKVLRTYYQPEGIYAIQLSLPKELLANKQIEEVLNSIVFLKDSTNVHYDIFKPKMDTLFADLVHKDSLVFEKAKNALRDYVFTEQDKPLLLKALQKNYRDDTLKNLYGDAVKEHIWQKIEDLLKKKTTQTDVAELKKYALADTANHETARILENITRQRTQESIDIMLEILQKKPQAKLTYNVLPDSTELLKKNFEKFLAYPDRRAFQVLALTASKNIINEDSLAIPLIQKHLLILTQMLDRGRQGNDTIHIDGLHKDFVTLAGYLPATPTLLEALKSVLQSEPTRMNTRIDALDLLLKNKQTPLPAHIEGLLKDEAYFEQLVDVLIAHKRLDLLPKAYQKQSYMAEKLAYAKLKRNTYEGKIEKFALIKKIKVQYDGKPTYFYLYKADIKSYEKMEYIIFLGAFDKDKKNLYPQKMEYRQSLKEYTDDKKYNEKWILDIIQEDAKYEEAED